MTHLLLNAGAQRLERMEHMRQILCYSNFLSVPHLLAVKRHTHLTHFTSEGTVKDT